MIIAYIVVLLLIMVLVWDAVKGFHIIFSAQASATQIIARIGSILAFEIQKNALTPMLIIHLFGIRLHKALVAKHKPGGIRKGLRLARAAAISGLEVSADYGLGDPLYTAMILPAVGATARLLPFERLDVEPDYLSVEPYLSLRGNVTVKFGKTIRKFIQNK